ncbi:MAG: AAA family ATPase [Acidimicrobiales bacterium]
MPGRQDVTGLAEPFETDAVSWSRPDPSRHIRSHRTTGPEAGSAAHRAARRARRPRGRPATHERSARYGLAVPLVLITGLPGSGKSTLAAALAVRLELPLIAKDRFKEILFETLGVRDMAWSRQLGVAAVALQFDAMRTVHDAVVDSALWTDRSEPELNALGLPMVQLYCDCPFELARQRFFERLQTGDRHRGFTEEGMTNEDFERFRPLTEPLRLSAPLVRVDTTTPVDAQQVADMVITAQSTERALPIAADGGR